jgi:predicted transglutaminase-like cysteine proteinase
VKIAVSAQALRVGRAAVRIALVLVVLGAFLTAPVAIGATAPVGYRAFCMRLPSDDLCRVRTAAVTLTRSPWLETLLTEINVYWNHRLTWTSDEVLYGRPEYWSVPAKAQGDCEDYALAKYGQLRRLGIPGGALSLIYGKLKSTGEGHAVLSVRTDEGLLVLGSSEDAVLPLASSEIAPMLIEDSVHPAIWSAVAPDAAAGVAIVADH